VNFGFFDSPEIEFVLIVLTLIAGMNFGTLLLVVTGRSLRYSAFHVVSIAAKTGYTSVDCAL